MSIGYKAMVSSANPKVVPPNAISATTNTTNKNSFPFVLFDKAAIPASKVPVLLTKPIIPPQINTKTIISTVSIIPSIGDIITANGP